MIKYLALERPVDASRIDIFPYAEAFASFIKMGIISAQGKSLLLITNFMLPFSLIYFHDYLLITSFFENKEEQKPIQKQKKQNLN